MKIVSLLRSSLLGFLFLLLTAERCVEITEINAPQYVSPGTAFQVKTRLKHLDNTQNDFNLDYYLSYDRMWNPEDQRIGTTLLTNFPVNLSREVNQSLTVPAGTFMGHYYLIAKAQDGEMYRQVSVNGPVNVGVDLVPANLFTYGSDKPGNNFRFAFSLLNRGMQQSPQNAVRCYFSTNTKIDSADRLMYTVPISSVMPGNSVREFTGLEFVIPDDLPAGDYYFIVAADAGDAVTETEERNNTVSKLVKIGASLDGPVEERSETAAAQPPAGISEPQIALAPNPATDFLNVSFELAAPARVSLDVLDLSGNTLESFRERQMDAGAYTQRVELTEWPAGAYLVRTVIDGRINVRKIVKH